MKNMTNKYLTGASIIVLTFSLNADAASAATCPVMPTCAELGYTKTSCTNGQEAIKCPFDKTKMRCLVTTSTTCVQFGYTQNSGSCEGAFFDKVVCPIDKNYFRCEYNTCNPIEYPINTKEFDIDPDAGEVSCCESGLCKYLFCWEGYEKASVQANNHPGMMDVCVPAVYDCNSDKANMGDYYYGNGKCSSLYAEDPQVIGILYDKERKLIASVEPGRNLAWNDGSEALADIPDLTNYSTKAEALTNGSGKANTDKIIAYAQADGQTHEAAEYCHNMRTGGLTWFLPSLGQIYPNYPNLTYRQNIRIFMDRINDRDGLNQEIETFWSSTEASEAEIWLADTNIAPKFLKDTPFNTICFASYDENYTESETQTAPVNLVDCIHGDVQVGDIYYNDDTCGGLDSNKTAIGVVVDNENRFVMGLDSIYGCWNDCTTNYQDIPDVPHYYASGERNNLDGLTRTNQIVAFAQSSGQAHQTAQACHDKTTGGKTWYLPTIGQIAIAYNNRELLSDATSLMDRSAFSSEMWASQEGSSPNEAQNGACYSIYNGTPGPRGSGKNAKFYSRCMFNY